MWHGDVAQRKGRISSARGVRVAELGSGGRRRRRERTLNILIMSVTLEVSKLSGWLKADATCRVQRGHPSEGNAYGTEMWHRGKGESAARAACVWPSLGVGVEGAGGSAPGT